MFPVAADGDGAGFSLTFWTVSRPLVYGHVYSIRPVRPVWPVHMFIHWLVRTVWPVRPVRGLYGPARNAAGKNLNRTSRAHERYRQTIDDRQIDGRAIAYSEREREFTFAKNGRGTVGTGCSYCIHSLKCKKKYILSS